MCILLKLDDAKFGVSDLFFSNVIEEKSLGGLGVFFQIGCFLD